MLKLLFRIFRFICLLFLWYPCCFFLVFSLAIDPLQAGCLGLSLTLLARLPRHLDFNFLLCASLFVSVTFDSFWRHFNSMPVQGSGNARSVVVFMFILRHNFRRFTSDSPFVLCHEFLLPGVGFMPRFYDTWAWPPLGQLIKNETWTNEHIFLLTDSFWLVLGSIGCPVVLSSIETLLLVVVLS